MLIKQQKINLINGKQVKYFKKMSKTPKEFDRDLTKQLLFPTLSWSSVSSWEYAKKYNDRGSWYNQYVLGIRSEVNDTMKAGIEIGQKLVSNQKFLPKVPRPSIYEHTLKATVSGITITGHMDGWTPEKLELLEYKTSINRKRWTQKEVDKWGQITFYCLLLWLNDGIKPENIYIRLVAILTEDTDKGVKLSKSKEIKIFETKRTMTDIIKFISYLEKVFKEMNDYYLQRLSQVV